MKWIIKDAQGRYKCWNGGFYYSPLPDDVHILVMTSELEVLFFFKQGVDFLFEIRDNNKSFGDETGISA